MTKSIILCSILFSLLTACGLDSNYAPVSSAWQLRPTKANIHIVRADETLYAIAWYYDQDYQYLAKINHLTEPYTIYAGQKIIITPEQTTAKANTTKKIHPAGRKSLIKSSNTMTKQDNNINNS